VNITFNPSIALEEDWGRKTAIAAVDFATALRLAPTLLQIQQE